MSARRFFALFSSIYILFSLLSCRRAAVPPQAEQVLGTVCAVNAFEGGTQQLYEELFARLAEIDARFSTTRDDSDLSTVNAAAGLHAVKVHEDVLFVVGRALDYARLSDGAFDPSIGPLVRLWGINTDHARVPAQEEIDAVLPLVDWHKIELDENACTIFLQEKGMALELGGIAKGYAADELVKILDARKVRRAIIDLGGNVYVYGKKKDGSDWKVGVKNPLEAEGEPALVLSLGRNISVVTSGVYERFFIADGIRYHHILDTRTGRPADGDCLSATIVAASSLEADALSTIAFLLGAEKYSAISDVPAIFINSDASVSASSSLAPRLRAQSPVFSAIKYF